MKKLADLSWTPTWTSLAGCIHGCLTYLGQDISPAWLFGGTGHAFIINMNKDGSCPSGPTAWVTTPFFNLGKNLGWRIEGVFGDKRRPGFDALKRQAWELVKASLDSDLPVVGWELAIPEFYVVDGYDDAGYYFHGPAAEMGPSPKPWDELGESEIGMLEIFSIQPCQPAEDRKTIHDALAFALAFNRGNPEWVLPEYLAGQAAYQAWIEALESGRAMRMGHAYNAAVWEECRSQAVTFLREAKGRLQGELEGAFEGAIQAYGETAAQLKLVAERYPFFQNNTREPVGENPTSQEAADCLQLAMAAEAEGSAYLEEITQGLA